MDEELLKLIDLVLEQIKKDVADGDVTAIEEMLTISVDKNHLNQYLPEDKQLSLKEINPVVCEDCGSTNVEYKAWVDCESGNYQAVSGEREDNWCNNCQEHVKLIYKSEYDEMQEEDE